MSQVEPVTEQRTIEPFERLVLKAHGRLELAQGNEESLEIETAPELLERVLAVIRADAQRLS